MITDALTGFTQPPDKLEFVGLFGQWRAVPMRYTSLPPALVRGVVPVRTLVPGGVRHPHIFHKKVR